MIDTIPAYITEALPTIYVITGRATRAVEAILFRGAWRLVSLQAILPISKRARLHYRHCAFCHAEAPSQRRRAVVGPASAVEVADAPAAGLLTLRTPHDEFWFQPRCRNMRRTAVGHR